MSRQGSGGRGSANPHGFVKAYFPELGETNIPGQRISWKADRHEACLVTQLLGETMGQFGTHRHLYDADLFVQGTVTGSSCSPDQVCASRTSAPTFTNRNMVRVPRRASATTASTMAPRSAPVADRWAAARRTASSMSTISLSVKPTLGRSSLRMRVYPKFRNHVG